MWMGGYLSKDLAFVLQSCQRYEAAWTYHIGIIWITRWIHWHLFMKVFKKYENKIMGLLHLSVIESSKICGEGAKLFLIVVIYSV